MTWGVSSSDYVTPWGCSSQPNGENRMPVVQDHGSGELLIIGMKID